MVKRDDEVTGDQIETTASDDAAPEQTEREPVEAQRDEQPGTT